MRLFNQLCIAVCTQLALELELLLNYVAMKSLIHFLVQY